MKQQVEPRIERKAFEEVIIRIQENEGNDPIVVNAIAHKIQGAQGARLLDAFIAICNEYHVGYACYKESKANKHHYNLIVKVNGRDCWSVMFDDASHDFSEELAAKLYAELATQIRNEAFVKSVKKGPLG
jgi:hypothetical protein